MKITDLELGLQALLAELGKHPRIVIGLGSKTVVIYVANHQLKKLVESRIPTDYLAQIQVVVTGRLRPARGTPSKTTTQSRTGRG